MNPERIDPRHVRAIADTLGFLYEHGDVIELRVLEYQDNTRYRGCTMSGWYDLDHLEKLARDALALTGNAMGCYVTQNPVNPALQARAKNRLIRAKQDETTKDKDIVRRIGLVLDADYERPAGISATDEEKAECKAVLNHAVAELTARGWPEPMITDSGNGYHAYYRVDLPANDEGLLKRVLHAIHRLFSSEHVKIDVSMSNASRIFKLPYTMARKGEDLPERPHRRAEVVHFPDRLVTVTREQLDAIAAEGTEPAPAPAPEPRRSTERTPQPSAGNWNGISTADDYAIRGDWREILEPKGWQEDGTHGEETRWKRPGKDAQGISATTGYQGRNVFHVFTTGAPPFEANASYTKFSTYSLLYHGGDDSAAGRDLYEQGYGTRQRHGSRLRSADRPQAALPPPSAIPPTETPPRENDGPPPDDGERPPPGEPDDNRPEIIVTHNIHEVVEQAVAVIAQDPDIFQRGSCLVRVVTNQKPPQTMENAEGTPMITMVTVPRLIEVLSRAARWMRWKQVRDELVLVPTSPSEQLARIICDRCYWPGVRPLTAICEAPTLRPDGSILQVPGYDAETGLLYRPEIEFPAVPDRPTREDAERSAAKLLNLVCDFPFLSPVHAHAWLACLLTNLLRPAIRGACPMFVYDANTAGSGKTKLCDLVAILSTGRTMPRSSYAQRNEEMEKVILSVVMAGVRHYLLDNLQTGDAIGGPALDRVLTATTINERILGSSKMSGELPVYPVFHASGNNLGLRGDALRRVIPIRLESPLDRPEERDDFSLEQDLLEYTRSHRGELVQAALIIARAFVVAGRPGNTLLPMDYTAWCRLIRDSIFWVTSIDPCETRRGRIAVDTQTQELVRLLAGWDQLCQSAGKNSLTAGEAIRILNENESAHSELRDLLCEWSKDGRMPSSRAMGRRMTAFRGRASHGRAIDFEVRDGNVRWLVRDVKPTNGHGIGGNDPPANGTDHTENGKEAGGWTEVAF